MHYLGIDISKATFNVCLSQSETQWAGEFENNNRGFKKLKKWLDNHQVEQLHACLEATGRYGEALTHWLYNQGYQVSVVNPQVIHHYAKTQMRRNKNDQLDARLIARYVEKRKTQIVATNTRRTGGAASIDAPFSKSTRELNSRNESTQSREPSTACAGINR